MLIVMRPDLQPRMQDEWEFNKFAVHVHGKADLGALHSVGVPDGTNAVWVRPAWLRDNCTCWGNDAWQARFDAMVEAARSHGWVHAETGNIKAHIVQIDRAAPTRLSD